jgi:hypothetical protein
VEFKKFLIRIDKEVPAHLQVHLIVDNYGTHKTPAIKAWLARHPRFELHFTPTGSSWINHQICAGRGQILLGDPQVVTQLRPGDAKEAIAFRGLVQSFHDRFAVVLPLVQCCHDCRHSCQHRRKVSWGTRNSWCSLYSGPGLEHLR